MNRLLVSTLTFIIAFILTNLFMQGLIYMFAYGLGYEPTFSYGSIHTITDYRIWTRFRILEVYFLPPVICLAMGLLLYRSMHKQEESWGRMQLFAYWCMVCLINIFFAQLFFSPLGVANFNSVFYETLSIVMVWMHLPVEIATVISVLSCIASILLGYMLAVETIKLSHSRKLVADTQGKNILIIQLYILPVVLSTFPVLLLANGNADLRIAATLINLLLFPVGMFLRNSISPYRVGFQRAHIGNHFPLSTLVVCAVLWVVVFRFFH